MNTVKKKKSKFLIIVSVVFLLFLLALFIVYLNFNRLLSQTLKSTFNTSIVSDVYEINFDDLSVNVFEGNIKVFNVLLQPLKAPQKKYPYINSTLKLKAQKIVLENVDIVLLLKSGVLKLDKITIDQPDVELKITEKLPIFFPINESVKTVTDSRKKFISGFLLKEFALNDATIHTLNLAAQREYQILNLNILVTDLFIDQQNGMDIISNKHAELSIGASTGILKKDAVKNLSFKDFKIAVDSIHFVKTLDTITYKFSDFKTSLSALDVQTADSIYHLALGGMKLSYKNKSIQLNNIVFKPNVSNDVIQKKFKYLHAEFSGTVGKLEINNINFDALLHQHNIFIDEIKIDNVVANLYKDKTKLLDRNRFPEYFGQSVLKIPFQVQIKNVAATHVTFINNERKEDSTFAKVTVNRGTLSIKNVSNLSTSGTLLMSADAFIENKAHAFLTLGFDYAKPQFTIDVKVKPFNLPDLNSILKAYTPASISKGTADEILFKGTAFKTNATGTMKFLYHDLAIDLALNKEGGWANTMLGFVANTSLHSSNPISENLPERVVTFNAERDMNKGFFNIIIRSILSGFKETMIMNKENRKAYKKAKKEMKQRQSK